MGAKHDECKVVSPSRTANFLLIITLAEHPTSIPGPAGEQDGSLQVSVIPIQMAAFLPSTFTFVEPGDMIFNGNAGWGTGVGTGAAGWIGAWQ